jgi:hypothetical protein
LVSPSEVTNSAWGLIWTSTPRMSMVSCISSMMALEFIDDSGGYGTRVVQ